MKGSIRTTRAWRRLVGGVVAVAAMAFVASASATTATVGQTTSTGTFLCGQYWFAQADYAVPAGSWQITAWSTQAGTPGGSMALLVFRERGRRCVHGAR